MSNYEMNVKQTLKNLHKRFPEMSLDDLFEILDCYSDYELNYYSNYKLNQKNCNSSATNISFYKTNGICESITTGNIK